MSYAEKLQDFRWKLKREEMARVLGYKCCACPATKDLHLHHRYYVSGREPWEYPDCAYRWLCRPCHDLAAITDSIDNIERRGKDPLSILFLLDAAKGVSA